MRQVPSGFRAKTTEAACPAVECWIQPYSSRSTSCARSSASSPSDKRFTGRDHCIGASPVSSSSSTPQSCGRPGGAPPNTPAYLLLMAVNAGSSAPARCSAETERGEVQLGAVFQHFHSVGKTSCRRLFGGSPGSASSTCSLTVRRLQRSQVELTRRGPRPLAGTIPTNDSGTPGRQPESQPPLPVRAPPYR